MQAVADVAAKKTRTAQGRFGHRLRPGSSLKSAQGQTFLGEAPLRGGEVIQRRNLSAYFAVTAKVAVSTSLSSFRPAFTVMVKLPAFL